MTTTPDPTKRPTAVVIDDSRAIQIGLPAMVPDMDFVGTYSSVEAFLVAQMPADVVILDLRLSAASELPVLQGLAAVRRLAKDGYRICLYTDERRRFVLAQCLRAGAHGVVHKSDSEAVTSAALHAVASGTFVITQSLTGLAEVLDRRGGLPELTPRQREVLQARARGERWASIARRLYITEGVAREHMAAVSAKFAGFLVDASPADIERQLGIAPGDIFDGD